MTTLREADMTETAEKKRHVKRPTFKEIRQREQGKYETMMQELADEVNALKAQLDAEREALSAACETLAAIRGSWLAALRYRWKGEA